MSTWVITFEDKVVKAIGDNEVIAAHINIPRYLPPARYYSLAIDVSYNRAFVWMWSYITGNDVEGLVLTFSG